MPEVHPVILSGGRGTRLWPVSRASYPKQFIRLLGEDTLFQRTLRRFSGKGFGAPLVMTADEYRFIALEQAEATGLADARVVVEPAARDTAPAILAAALMLQGDPDALMIVAPSDHVILDEVAFHSAIQTGKDAAAAGALVTFGITPDAPKTGYGYLRMGAGEGAAKPVAAFVEKPDLAAAKAMLDTGGYLWNGGLFMGRVKDFLAAFKSHAPHLIAPVTEAVQAAEDDLGFTRLAAGPFGEAQAISLDYAVMEKAGNVMAVPLDCGWSDLGSWDALWQAAGPDAQGNVSAGAATLIDCEGSYVRSEEPGLAIVGLGLRDVIAVAMRDAVLVADKGCAEEVKGLVDTLRRAEQSQADEHPRFHRPWGWYETLCIEQRFQVKRIMVKPGGTLSLQSHRHRSEHWIVVAGTAEVTLGDEVSLVTENQSIYVPLGQKHRLSNPGKVPMYLIEVQTGAYLGEDDIVRFEDIYDRV